MPRSGQKLTAIRLTRNELAVLQNTDEEEHCRLLLIGHFGKIVEKKMKEIKLIPDAPFYNSVDVHVMDFPHGRDGEERQRCKITVEFAKTDVDDLRKRGMGLTEAMEYYRGWIYDIVKVHISQDWECISGMEETLAIVEERVKTFF